MDIMLTNFHKCGMMLLLTVSVYSSEIIQEVQVVLNVCLTLILINFVE